MSTETVREKIARQMREEDEKREKRAEELLQKMKEAGEATVVKYHKLVEKGVKKKKAKQDLIDRIAKIDEDIEQVSSETDKYELELVEIEREEEIIKWRADEPDKDDSEINEAQAEEGGF